jgi:hypothetical protein
MKTLRYCLTVIILVSLSRCSDFNLTKNAKIKNIWEAAYILSYGNDFNIDTSYSLIRICASGDTLVSSITIEKKHFYQFKKSNYALVERTITNNSIFYYNDCFLLSSAADTNYNRISKGLWEFYDGKDYLLLHEDSWTYNGSNSLYEITKLKGKEVKLKSTETILPFNSIIFTKAEKDDRLKVDSHY